MKAWLKLLTGPLAWFASLCISFWYVPWACAARSSPLLMIFPVAAILLTVFSGWLAWSDWRHIGREFPGEASGTVPRDRVLASGAVLLNGFFVIVLLAQMVAPGILGACE
jgi:hypothetical protein